MKVIDCVSSLSKALQKLQFVPTFLTRITLGSVFIGSGWGKLHHLDKTIAFFDSIGIPAAHIQAPFAATTELVCGSLVLAGLATRFASLPLIVIMMVAIRTAKWDDVMGVSSLFEISEYLYIVLLSWLATHGPGKLSLDYLFRKTGALWEPEKIGDVRRDS